jgi:hypothetical protein
MIPKLAAGTHRVHIRIKLPCLFRPFRSRSQPWSARHSHPNKSRWWVVDRYYGQFNPTKRNRWVFDDRDSGAYLPKFAWTKIVRHAMVAGAASPDDPTLNDYWTERRRKQAPPPLSAPVRHLLGVQQGRCARCGGFCFTPINTRKARPNGNSGCASRGRDLQTAHHHHDARPARRPSSSHPLLLPTPDSPRAAERRAPLPALTPSGLA